MLRDPAVPRLLLVALATAVVAGLALAFGSGGWDPALVVALLTSVGLGVFLVNLGMAWHARPAEAVGGRVLSGL